MKRTTRFYHYKLLQLAINHQNMAINHRRIDEEERDSRQDLLAKLILKRPKVSSTVVYRDDDILGRVSVRYTRAKRSIRESTNVESIGTMAK